MMQQDRRRYDGMPGLRVASGDKTLDPRRVMKDFAGSRMMFFDAARDEEMRTRIRKCGGVPLLLSLHDDTKMDAAAFQQLLQGDVDGLLFTEPMHIAQLLECAGRHGREKSLREVLRRTCIGALHAEVTASLVRAHVGMDYEPDGTTLADLVNGMARSAGYLLEKKRYSHAQGVDTSCSHRVDLIWPNRNVAIRQCPILKACRKESTPGIPIWIMRQAGRYLREYRTLREKLSFMEMCKRPEVAAEVTLMAVDRLGVDAAIIFSDILLILEPMKVGLQFRAGDGPCITRPIRTAEDVARLPGSADVEESLAFVYEAIRMTRRALHPMIPLIGFSGAPFTLASYLIEGGASRHYERTKTFMHCHPDAWRRLMLRLVDDTVEYLDLQIQAGAQLLQLFDSWMGCLSAGDYYAHVFPYVQRLLDAMQGKVPLIYFGTGNQHLFPAMRDLHAGVIGCDWRMPILDAWAFFGESHALQGNLDPVILLTSPEIIQAEARRILQSMEGKDGFIFNLGHGVLPQTPIDNVLTLIDTVHAYGIV